MRCGGTVTIIIPLAWRSGWKNPTQGSSYPGSQSQRQGRVRDHRRYVLGRTKKQSKMTMLGCHFARSTKYLHQPMAIFQTFEMSCICGNFAHAVQIVTHGPSSTSLDILLSEKRPPHLSWITQLANYPHTFYSQPFSMALLIRALKSGASSSGYSQTFQLTGLGRMFTCLSINHPIHELPANIPERERDERERPFLAAYLANGSNGTPIHGPLKHST